MKIKEALVASIDQMDRKENNGAFNFLWFEIGLSQFCIYIATIILEKDMPDVRFNETKTGGKGIPLEKVTGMDILRVLGAEDIMRNTTMFMLLLDFFEWFINENVPVNIKIKDGSYLSWNDLEFLAAKWNEFVVMHTEEEGK